LNLVKRLKLRMETVTVLGLEVVDIIPEKSVILVKGSVPGATGSLLELRDSVIKQRKKGQRKLQKVKELYAAQ